MNDLIFDLLGASLLVIVLVIELLAFFEVLTP